MSASVSVSPTAILEPAARRRARGRIGGGVRVRSRIRSRFEVRTEPNPVSTTAGSRLAAATGLVRTAAAAGSSPAIGCGAVREAYVETVLSLPHYEQYDETWLESVAAEFTPDLAATLEGSRFHPQLNRSLEAAIDQAVTNRTELLEVIAAERDAIGDAAADLSTIEADRESLLGITENTLADLPLCYEPSRLDEAVLTD